ncbi:MAG: ATP synthase subunit I [Desulfomonilaceae bacterium]
MNFERVPRIWLGVSAALYAAGALLSVCVAPVHFVLGYVAGGALVLANAWAGGRKVKRSEFRQKGAEIAGFLAHFYARLLLLGVSLFVLIKYAKVDPLGLVTGLSVAPAGLFVMLFLIYLANRTPEEV